jgi:hypothetical protein
MNLPEALRFAHADDPAVVDGDHGRLLAGEDADSPAALGALEGGGGVARGALDAAAGLLRVDLAGVGRLGPDGNRACVRPVSEPTKFAGSPPMTRARMITESTYQSAWLYAKIALRMSCSAPAALR